MSMINTVPTTRGFAVTQTPEGDFAIVEKEWSSWFTQVFNICYATQQSGPTGERPTRNLWVGRTYFDTSLGAKGKPIWVDKTGTAWVLADGTAA